MRPEHLTANKGILSGADAFMAITAAVLVSTVHEIAPPKNNHPHTVGSVCVGVHRRGGHARAER